MPPAYQPIVERRFLDAGQRLERPEHCGTRHGCANHPRARQSGAAPTPAPALRGRGGLVPALSEPGAGSDLASLATMARPDGPSGYRVSGQKIWTSRACGITGSACRRTDADAPQTEGLSYPSSTCTPTKSRFGPSTDDGGLRVQRGLSRRRLGSYDSDARSGRRWVANRDDDPYDERPHSQVQHTKTWRSIAACTPKLCCGARPPPYSRRADAAMDPLAHGRLDQRPILQHQERGLCGC